MTGESAIDRPLVAAYLLLFFPPTGNDINPGVPGFGYSED